MTPRRLALPTTLAALVLILAAGAARAESTLDRIRDYGVLRCGLTDLGAGLGTLNAQGRWIGFYPQLCRAVAAAVLGDPEAVEFIRTSPKERFDNLRQDHYDVLIESSTWTLGRDADGLTFLPPYLFDGQTFLVAADSDIQGVADLQGRTICVQENASSTDNIKDENRFRDMGWTIETYESLKMAVTAFYDRACDAVTTDALVLASVNRLLAANPDAYRLLPDRISKEPLGAVVRDDDPAWADVVRWVIQALIAAEELGITRQGPVPDTAEARRLLGRDGGLGRHLGLDRDWAARAVRTAGNYGELYGETIEADLGIPRGHNELWTRGGLLMARPLR